MTAIKVFFTLDEVIADRLAALDAAQENEANRRKALEVRQAVKLNEFRHAFVKRIQEEYGIGFSREEIGSWMLEPTWRAHDLDDLERCLLSLPFSVGKVEVYVMVGGAYHCPNIEQMRNKEVKLNFIVTRGMGYSGLDFIAAVVYAATGRL